MVRGKALNNEEADQFVGGRQKETEREVGAFDATELQGSTISSEMINKRIV